MYYYIINYLYEHRGLDISCYNKSFIERRLTERLIATKTNNYAEYVGYLKKNKEEFNCLLDALRINVSQFFRNNLIFEILSDKIIPSLITEKMKLKDNNLRIWSGGCANGEETYSIAILIKEALSNEDNDFNISIFGTDIDRNAIKKAREGIYNFETIKEVKYGLLKKYFIEENNLFKIIPEIKKFVNFSIYDLTSRSSFSPPEAIFGSFDLVMCRNVLIYFNEEFQEIILSKLYRSLVKNKFLVLGEFEEPINYRKYFKRYNDFCHIYQKE